jgi:capsid protein
MMRDPLTTRHYPNLPANQQAAQRLADEFNAAEREWERTHPAKPKRKAPCNGRKAVGTVATGKRQPVKHGIGFARP